MQEYLSKIAEKFKDPQTSEMGYRTDFENLLETIFLKSEKYHIHHDAKSVGGNKPDFVVLKNTIPILYIENKDIGVDLNKIEKSNQMERYFGYDNLILTDQVEFRFYRNGEKYGESIKIANYNKINRTIQTLPENFSPLEKTIIDFTNTHKEPIKRGKHLAQVMGGKAQRIRDNVLEMLVDNHEKYADLLKIRDVVRENLVSGLEDDTFADMYAQTLVYGLFAARYNDKTPNTFSRMEARELVPKTNPFLHSFFDHIAGSSFPERLRFIVDELCEVFTHADVKKILQDHYRKEKDSKDPIIHFYEDFLKEYDAKKKMEMGVFYTPQPVVQFIVRSVDSILKQEFNIPKGLADTEKVTIKKQEYYQAKDKTKLEQAKDGKLIEVKKEYHRVQVLDVATGTGTFLNEVIAHIYKSFEGQEGRWDSYVKEHLLPRLHGFELMMASYTIAHLKLGMTLTDSGVQGLNQRLGVYLTNTLEEAKGYENQGTLFGFMDAIAEESKSASKVKAEYPIMCVIGNPPYSGISQNKMYTANNAYKVEPGGQTKLQERKHWLDDDYVKFIRFAESLIEKNEEGVIAMITAHGYVDNPTFRGMRWHLRNTFDTLYVVDLHGNSNKKEISPDGSTDENVFDIKTGVAIVFGIKKRNQTGQKNLAPIHKLDVYGLRKQKFETLIHTQFETIPWQQLPHESEIWILEGEGKNEYLKGFSVADIFPKNSTGFVTAKDSLNISFLKNESSQKLSDLHNLDEFEFRKIYKAPKDSRDWQYLNAKSDSKTCLDEKFILINYRPFDSRWTYYTGKSRGLYASPQQKIMNEFISHDNIGIMVCRQQKTEGFTHVLVHQNAVESSYVSNKTSEIGSAFPLYLHNESDTRIPNVNKEIWNQINKVVGETTPENILDYIYAVLYSPTYREKYKSFLKSDFPRVPYPENKTTFVTLVEIGKKLRELHLFISKEAHTITTTYPVNGDDIVEKVSYKDGNVYINTNQYFGNVSEIAWNFYIGGYQPAQKYLKDRKGRRLTSDEIEHYQKNITVLNETDKLMQEIDTVFKNV